MITVTGLIEFDYESWGPRVSIRHKCNMYWDDCLEEAKAVYEFDFEYDKDTDSYEFVKLRKITKAKAQKNKT
jgi:hypothetical protein